MIIKKTIRLDLGIAERCASWWLSHLNQCRSTICHLHDCQDKDVIYYLFGLYTVVRENILHLWICFLWNSCSSIGKAWLLLSNNDWSSSVLLFKPNPKSQLSSTLIFVAWIWEMFWFLYLFLKECYEELIIIIIIKTQLWSRKLQTSTQPKAERQQLT